ncbi:hypothetical protein NDU88_000756 [Pleurodeles waltl]|uniref:Uncharacterized protein n=1 Tax=Pleurodeles waltl TaxID=8319 RepID=A0AAV7NBG1_PLEWA|nr:hypothetical protein NDU88_000756 [Pleurodeles waltl]
MSVKRKRKKRAWEASRRQKTPWDNRRSTNAKDGKTPLDDNRSANTEDEKMLLPTPKRGEAQDLNKGVRERPYADEDGKPQFWDSKAHHVPGGTWLAQHVSEEKEEETRTGNQSETEDTVGQQEEHECQDWEDARGQQEKCKCLGREDAASNPEERRSPAVRGGEEGLDEGTRGGRYADEGGKPQFWDSTARHVPGGTWLEQA